MRDGGAQRDADELGPVHVHGLGINPSDGALYIATHTGMWRLAPGADPPVPVGTSRQDTMGFTVVGPDRFLGSGHPDNLDEPPLLGLIESVDRGGTWKPISLAGQADFHVLRAVGARVYGYDVSHERLLASTDGGKTWADRTPPAAVLDVAPNPGASNRLVAATAAGLIASADAGKTWRRIGELVGLLGWPSPNRLYLVSMNGDVFVSRNGGRRWQLVGTVDGKPSAFLAHTTSRLYAALHDGRLLRSQDAGRNWSTLSRATR